MCCDYYDSCRAQRSPWNTGCQRPQLGSRTRCTRCESGSVLPRPVPAWSQPRGGSGPWSLKAPTPEPPTRTTRWSTWVSLSHDRRPCSLCQAWKPIFCCSVANTFGYLMSSKLKLSNQGGSIHTLQNQLTHYTHLFLLGRTEPSNYIYTPILRVSYCCGHALDLALLCKHVRS